MITFTLYSVLIIAIGLSKPNVPENLRKSTLGYEDFEGNPDDYEGKSVLILGKNLSEILKYGD